MPTHMMKIHHTQYKEVEGKDYWQAYENAGEGSFELTFNVHNRGTVEYRLIR